MQAQTADTELPFIDEHAHIVAAPPERAWAALVHIVPRAFGGPRAERFARVARSEVAAPDGAFPAEGATVPGFRVARADPPRELILVGRHWFSRYALIFRLDPRDDGRATRVRAESRAEFPGLAGRAYRLAVIGTRGHVLVVRRLLRAIARRAERAE